MVVTAGERREILNLFNVSEAARRLGIPVQQMHRRIRAGRLRLPDVKLGKRSYYRGDDLPLLEQQVSQNDSRP